MVFSIVLILLLLALFFTATWKAGKFQSVPHIKELRDAFTGVSAEEFDTVNVERIIGRGGYVQILDEKNQVVYSNDKAHGKGSYSRYEMSYIADSDVFSLITVEQYEQPDGTVEQVITTNSYTEDGREVRNDVYAVDEELNILYSTASKEKTRLTAREYQLLTDKISKKYTLSKTHFTDGEGKSRAMLAFSPRTVKNTFERVKRSYLALAVEFLAVYAVIAFLFSFWVARRVKKPLRILGGAMEAVSAGNRGVVTEYRGPKEFVEICENFNQMSLALEEAEKANLKLQQEKQKLIADISHDLKTPITVIKGYSKAIADGVAGPEEQKKYLKTIYRRSEELTELIEEFHDYAKIDHPDNRFDLEPVDLCEYVREYFADRYNEFDIGGYELVIDIDEEKVMVNLEVKKFCRVLDNIVGNFFKYCPPGSSFYCRAGEKDGKAAVVLADDGAGIPDEIRDTVFEPFIVGEKSRNSRITGSGLGLPLARKIVEGHGGTIMLLDRPEKLICDDTEDTEKVLRTGFVIILDRIKEQK